MHGKAGRKQIQIVQNQSQVDTNGAREMYLLELIESGAHRGTWASHITRTLTVWPCLMQWSIMIDIPAAVTSGPQYLIKLWGPRGISFIIGHEGRKDGKMADGLD